MWQQNGLWPVPFDELKGRGKPSKQSKMSRRNLLTKRRFMDLQHLQHGRGEIEELVTEIVSRELTRLFNNVVVSPIPKTARLVNAPSRMRSVCPLTFGKRSNGYFPGEIMSNVITAALRLYVNGKKELKELREAR